MQGMVVINKNRDFIRAYRKGKSAVTPCLALYYIKSPLPCGRYGITASKKIGNAVLRNRAKRVLRQALRQLMPSLRDGIDLVLVARGKTPHVKATQVYCDLYRVAAERGLLTDA